MTTLGEIRAMMRSDEFEGLADILALGDEAVAPLLRLAGSSSEPSIIRQRAIVALGEMGAQAAVAPLRSLLRDQDRVLRVMAIRALVKILGESAAPDLTAMLSDDEPSVAIAAARALGQVVSAGRGEAGAVLDALAGLPDDAHPSLVRAAEEARAAILER